MEKEWWEEFRKLEEKDRKEIDKICSKIRKERWAKVAVNHKVKFLNYPLKVKQFTSA